MMSLKKDLSLWNPKTNENKTLKAGAEVTVKGRKSVSIQGLGFAPRYRHEINTMIDGVDVTFIPEDFNAYVG